MNYVALGNSHFCAAVLTWKWWLDAFSKASSNILCLVNTSPLDQLFYFKCTELSLACKGVTVVSIWRFLEPGPLFYIQRCILECLDFFPQIRAYIPKHRDAQFQLKISLCKCQNKILDFLKIQEIFVLATFIFLPFLIIPAI